MSDPNGWPDEARPGVPLNPERDGAHAIEANDGEPLVMVWRDPWWTTLRGTSYKPCEVVARGMRYLGPCLTPSEVAAALAQARRDALEEAAQIADEHHTTAKRSATEDWEYSVSAAGRGRIDARAYEAERIAAAIRAKAQEGRDGP